MRLFPLVLALSLAASLARANPDGVPLSSPKNCGLSVFTAFDFLCKALDVPCKVEPDTCTNTSQEIYSGATLELASPGHFAPWTGFGGMGLAYQTAATCLLRDLREGAMTSKAKASVLVGDAAIEQEIVFQGFDQKSHRFDGVHHAKICVPVVGCFDAIYQGFSLVPVATSVKGTGQKIGDYEAYGTFAWDLETESQNQALKVSVPTISVETPYGPINATPEFGFGRHFGTVLAPFAGGNVKSLVATPMGNSKVVDLYGRNVGLKASQVFPTITYWSDHFDDFSRIGWQSDFGLGSRSADPKAAVWAPKAGVEFPGRPDLDLNVARSDEEKLPNVFAGADVRIEYKPTDLIPSYLRDSGFIKITFDVWAQPAVSAAFDSQFEFLSAEHSRWTGKKSAGGAPIYTPDQLDQVKTLNVVSATSAATRFKIDAGVDLNVHLHVPLFVGSFDEDLIDVHEPVTVADKISASPAMPSVKKISALSQASQIMLTKKPFQVYDTLKGPQDGLAHLNACLASPTPPGAPLPPPSYTPGNPGDLVKGIEYPCNICVGMKDTDFTDKEGKPHHFPAFLTSFYPADEGTRPAPVRWKCDQLIETGCFDMCKYDPATKKLTVVETALEMIAKGEAPKMPRRCR